MNHILHDLYYGDIQPSAGPPPETKAYKEVMDNIVKAEELLMEQLDEAGKACYNRLDRHTADLYTMERADIFENGFTLGARIMMACFMGGRHC